MQLNQCVKRKLQKSRNLHVYPTFLTENGMEFLRTQSQVSTTKTCDKVWRDTPSMSNIELVSRLAFDEFREWALLLSCFHMHICGRFNEVSARIRYRRFIPGSERSTLAVPKWNMVQIMLNLLGPWFQKTSTNPWVIVNVLPKERSPDAIVPDENSLVLTSSLSEARLSFYPEYTISGALEYGSLGEDGVLEVEQPYLPRFTSSG